MLAAAARHGGDFNPAQLKRLQVRAALGEALVAVGVRRLPGRRRRQPSLICCQRCCTDHGFPTLTSC